MILSTLRRLLGFELVEVSLAERLVATIGGGLSILALVTVTSWALPGVGAMGVIASMGASAVLLFGVPHGPLSQPWPVVAGHGFSALIGVVCAQLIAEPYLAAGCAVGLSIGVMQHLKCIHPPGGATAFVAVLGGTAVRDLGFQFVFFPVLSNAVVMVMLAVTLNIAFRWRRYPAAWALVTKHEPATAKPDHAAPTHEDVLAAVRTLDSFVDISEEDLLRLTELLARKDRKPR